MIIGKIWLKDGRILEFTWYIEYFAARAHYEKKQQLVRAIRSRWGCPMPPPSYMSQRKKR